MPSVPPACVQTLFIFSYALKCPSTPSSHLQVGPTHHPLPLSPLVLLFLRRGGLPHRASCSQPPGPARRASCSPPLGPVRRASSCPPPHHGGLPCRDAGGQAQRRRCGRRSSLHRQGRWSSEGQSHGRAQLGTRVAGSRAGGRGANVRISGRRSPDGGHQRSGNRRKVRTIGAQAAGEGADGGR